MWPYTHAKFEVASSNGLGVDSFTKQHISWQSSWGQGHTNIAQYPLCHLTYTHTKFEVATSNF